MFNRGGDGKARGFGFSGFSINKRGGSDSSGGDRSYGMVPGMAGRTGISHLGKRRIKNEEDYFDADEEQSTELEYQPAPGSPGIQGGGDGDSDASDDPLDAFMMGIEKEVKTQDKKQKDTKGDKKKGVRADIEHEDEMESYLRYMEENPMAGVILEDEEMLEYDADGNAILPEKKMIDPLPPIDHFDMDYEPFNKNFYEEHKEIVKLTPDEVQELRNKLGIRVSGLDPAKPVCAFGHFGFDENLIKAIIKAGYEKPMPIQSQGVPVALSGRDVIGIAKTGSGKTLTFLWPLLLHIMDQKELEPGDGPIGLICAPTRELSQQIYAEAKKFARLYNINVVCAYGGGSMWEQCKACEEGAEIIVATPGRLIDLVKKKATKLNRVTYLVLDEADRMFDMGFEPQVRSIANHVRPDRQTLLFSATFKRRIERLARDILTHPVRVVQGDIGEANEDVTQIVKVLPAGSYKWNWMSGKLVQLCTVGSVLIFVTKKTNSIELATNLKAKDFKVGLMHGDMSQSERNEVIAAFKKQEMPVLVATDVAARGLDFSHIRTVVNYDVARDIDTHTHRIGRTGRAGMKGTAYTLITSKDKDFAGHLVRNLEGASQHVPDELIDIANQNPWFAKSRFKRARSKKLGGGGGGLGFKERPGLGAGGGGGGGGGGLGAGLGAGSARAQGELTAAGFAKWEPNKAIGPQADRVSAMKSAFQNQYKTNFVNASVDTAWKGSTGTDDYTNPEVERPDYGSGSLQHAVLNTASAAQVPTHMALHMAQNAAQAASQTYNMAAPPPPGQHPPPPGQLPPAPGQHPPAPHPQPDLVALQQQFQPPGSQHQPPPPQPSGVQPSPAQLGSDADGKRKKRSRWDNS